MSEAPIGQAASVSESWCIRGRQILSEDIEQINCWVKSHPQWSRRRLSVELAQHWQWCTPAGQLKDIAVRDILNRLAAQGLIQLPARQRRGGRQVAKAARQPEQSLLGLEGSPAAQGCSLSELLPLTWVGAQCHPSQRALIAGLLGQHHYLGYPDPLGQIHYLVRDRSGREIACLLFGPAAWKVAGREAWIGWSDVQRQRGLGHIANNSRFLLLQPAPHLASYLLAQSLRRLRQDWPARQGQPLWLVETFVEEARFSGACYQAANWRKVGQTQGRTRNDRWHECCAPCKDIYLRPLVGDARQRLCAL